jgi:hypothetical protein
VTLRPWVVKLEAALQRACLLPPFSATLDMSELVRGERPIRPSLILEVIGPNGDDMLHAIMLADQPRAR